MEPLLLICLCQGTGNSWLVAGWRASLPTQCLCKRDLFKTTQPAGSRMRRWLRGSVSRLGFGSHVAFLAQLQNSRDLRGMFLQGSPKAPFPALWLTVNCYFVKVRNYWMLIKWEGAYWGNRACYRKSSLYSQPFLSPFVLLSPLSSFCFHIHLLCCSSLSTDRSDNHPGVSFSCYGCSWFCVLEVCSWRLVKAMQLRHVKDMFSHGIYWFVSGLLYLNVVSLTLIGNRVTWFKVRRAQRGMVTLKPPCARCPPSRQPLLLFLPETLTHIWLIST